MALGSPGHGVRQVSVLAQRQEGFEAGHGGPSEREGPNPTAGSQGGDVGSG
ncbi:hypothetical protein SZ55_3895 [Pseudomonas sp. FeS53a]|nr:hypothetical protein SZ55_3895 [Pseudomonas sp. FeS53a]